MVINSKKELDIYLNSLSIFNQGSCGKVYFDKEKNVIKIFFNSYDNDSINRFHLIDNNTFIFPYELIFYKDEIIGYKSKYVKGYNLEYIHPFKVNLDNLSKSIDVVNGDIELITKKGIKTYDVTYNTLFNGKDIYVIDTDDYSVSESNNLLKENMFSFSVGIKDYLTDGIFNEVVDSNKLLSEMYKDREVFAKEYLIKLREVLSNYVGNNINSLYEGKDYVNKEKHSRKYIRFI